uniref:Uncharacterized protein n=1 Tax=Rhabditophanes sp. KR3021 TaxID=114890 RepID=A0AC35TWR5_9BILA
MKLPFKVISKKEQGTVDVPSHHKAQQNVGLLGDGWSTSRPPRELQQHPEIQTEPLPHREIQQIPQVKVDPIYKYSSQSEDGLFLDPKKEQKVAKYMKDRTGLYLDVKAALATDPTLTHHSRLAYQQVEKYFRGIISIPEEEIRDIVDTFNLHIDSDYDIGYEELSREKIQTTSTLLILSLFIVFVILTVLTLIMVTKHLR